MRIQTLACPPETNLPGLCVQLATVWSLIEGAPLSANRGDEPPEIPEAAIAGVRETMDRMVGSYLARRGKKRYCDKSLGTARYAPCCRGSTRRRGSSACTGIRWM